MPVIRQCIASAAIIGAIALAACDRFITLVGHVVGPDGTPIRNARAQVVPDDLRPNQPAGTFEAHSSGGSITVAITADGYRPIEKTVSGGWVRYECTFTLAPTSGPVDSHAECVRVAHP
jgi:hypothetical protein